MADMKGQLEFDVEAGGASATIGALKRDLASLGRAAKDAGESSAQGMKQAADAGNSAASKLDAATSSMVSRIKRSMAELANGMKGSLEADLAERLGAARGLNPEALKPWIDALRQAEAGARSAARAQQLIDAANQQSLAAERELAKLRNQSQQQAGQDFLSSQRTAQAQATQRAIEAQRELVRALDAVNQAQRQGADAQTTSIVNEALVQAKQRSAAANAALADIGNGYRKTAEDLARLDAEATARGERAARALAGLRAAADRAAKDAFYAPQRERDAAAAEATTRAQQAQEAVARQLLASERELAGLRSQEQRTAAQDFLSAQRNAQAQATKRLTDAQQELQRAIEAVNQAERNGTSSASAKSRVDAAQQQVAAATAQMSALQQAAGSGSAQIRSRDAFISALQREAEAIGKTRTELLALQAAEMGVATQAAPMLQKLKEAEAGLGRTGVSAAQTAAAMRMVPAQITDIVTQLQMGTSPLTVLIQQGGQLRDMFGSVGGALRALGENLLNLAKNPLVLAAAAIATVATAYYQATTMADQFNKVIVMTGNQAGTTVGHMLGMAEAIATTARVTNGFATEALVEMANTGRVGAADLERFALAAVKLEKLGGPAAKETAKAFADLGKTPLEALLKLDEGMNFLTRDTYENVKALEKQGRTAEAAAAAQDAYLQATQRQIDGLRAQLGPFQKFMEEVAATAKSMWNAFTNNFVPASVDKQLENTKKRLEELQSFQSNGFKNAGIADAVRFGLPLGGKERLEAEIALQKQSLDNLTRQKLAEDNVAVSEAARVEQKRVFLELEKELGRVSVSSLTTEQRKARLQQEEAALRQKAATAKWEDSKLETLLAAKRKEYEEPAKPKGSAAPFNSQNRAEVEAVRQAERLKLEEIKQAQEAASLLRATGQANELQAIERTTELEIQALRVRADSLLQQAALVSKKKDSQGEARSLERQAAELAAQITTREIKGQNELTAAIYKRKQAIDATLESMRQEAQEEIEAARRRDQDAKNAVEIGILDRNQALKEEAQLLEQETGWIGQSNVQRRLGVELLRIHLNLQREIAKVQAMSGPNIDQDWRDQQIRALQDQAVRESAVAQRRVYVDEWERTSEQVGQSLSDALMEGGKSAGEYIKGLFRSMVLRPIVQAIVQPIVGTAGAMVSSLFGGGGGGGGSGVGGALNTASTVNSLYGMYTGASIATAGSAIYGAGTALGSTSMAAFGTGMQGAYLGAGLAGPTTAGATGAMGAGASFGSALATIGEYIPYVAAVLAVLNIFGAFRSKKVVGNGLVGTVGDGGDLDTYSLIRKGGTLLSGPDYSIRTQDADPTLVKGINDAVNEMLKQARDQANVIGQGGNLSRFTAPLGSELIHPEVGRYGISLAGLSEEDARKKVEEEINKLAEKMAEQALGPAGLAFAKMGETATQTFNRLAGSLKTVNTALENFNDALLDTSLSGADAASKLTDLFGGVDQFASATQAYYDRFFSEQEKVANSTRLLTKTFSELGLGSLPATKDAYRQLVNAQDLSTEAGRKAYASLISLSTAFADLKDAVEQAGKGVRDEIERLRGGGDAKDQASLQAQFGIKTAQARAGDAEALAALPELSKALEEATKNTASTAADVALARAQLAASLSETLRVLKVPGFASGGMHTGGWRVVGEVGPELEYTPPSRIFNQSQASSLINTDRIETLLTQLIERLDAAQDQGLRADTSLIIQTKKVADTLQAVVYGGQSLATRAGD